MLKPFFDKTKIEAGCDEAGRGCLAGPVYAAAVILPHDYTNKLLNDSKQLTEKQRDKLRPEIEKDAIAWAVAYIDNKEIDKINILTASICAMHKAVDQLGKKPELLLIDGNRFKPYKDICHKCIIKGDSLFMSIAAASVLAKTYRDEYMYKIHLEHPEYGWDKNKAYPTKFHRNAILKYGITKYHRLSYKLTDTQLKLF
ncbi:MAG TPA: ribonuclease HII [Bacteroidales bacterium]|nr:ribonuclease HII [Bacteroidales bacterium]